MAVICLSRTLSDRLLLLVGAFVTYFILSNFTLATKKMHSGRKSYLNQIIYTIATGSMSRMSHLFDITHDKVLRF